MDVEKQIAYWRDGATEDMEVAGELVASGRFRHGLFFAHLAVEKVLKARVVKATGEQPPKIHNLARLSEISGVELPDDEDLRMRRIAVFQLHGRYPDMMVDEIEEGEAHDTLYDAQELLAWLTKGL